MHPEERREALEQLLAALEAERPLDHIAVRAVRDLLAESAAEEPGSGRPGSDQSG